MIPVEVGRFEVLSTLGVENMTAAAVGLSKTRIPGCRGEFEGLRDN
jgi:hypothetical protein